MAMRGCSFIRNNKLAFVSLQQPLHHRLVLVVKFKVNSLVKQFASWCCVWLQQAIPWIGSESFWWPIAQLLEHLILAAQMSHAISAIRSCCCEDCYSQQQSHWCSMAGNGGCLQLPCQQSYAVSFFLQNLMVTLDDDKTDFPFYSVQMHSICEKG